MSPREAKRCGAVVLPANASAFVGGRRLRARLEHGDELGGKGAFGLAGSDRLDDLLDLVAGPAWPEIAPEGVGDGQCGGDELHLLAPFEAEAFLDAGVAECPARPADQEIVDLLWHSPAVHWTPGDDPTHIRRPALPVGSKTPGFP